jgi:hypothetical protein
MGLISVSGKALGNAWGELTAAHIQKTALI